MKIKAFFLSLIMGLSFSFMATANPNNTMQQAMSSSQSAASINDGELNQFAKAHKDVLQIQQKYQKKLQGNQDQQAVQEARQKAYQEMTKVIEDNGLTTQKYRQIAQMVEKSPKLQEKIDKMQ